MCHSSNGKTSDSKPEDRGSTPRWYARSGWRSGSFFNGSYQTVSHRAFGSPSHNLRAGVRLPSRPYVMPYSDQEIAELFVSESGRGVTCLTSVFSGKLDKPKKPKKARQARGKLTPDQVRDIRESGERAVDLAKKYNLSREYVYRVKRGDVYAWVLPESAHQDTMNLRQAVQYYLAAVDRGTRKQQIDALKKLREADAATRACPSDQPARRSS